MQVQRTLHQIFIIALLLFGSGCTSAAQSNQANTEFSEAELDQMLAPVALYPDSVLTHVLIAATYPLEVVQAARWLEQNPGLSGEAAVDAASGQDWDPSVQALVAFPQLLKRLNDDLIWTQQLGEAFISDETALLASIQRLRQRAYAQGSLNKMEHVVVEREREIIVIEPARREVIYVPYYDTRVVYGNWWWPAYPPVYWHEPAGYRTQVAFYWGSGFSIRPSFYFSIFDWQRRHVVVHHHYHHKPPRYYPKRQHFQHASRWQHDNYHRRGVHYQHRKLRDRQDFYHSRPEQRRAQPVRTAQHNQEWRAQRTQETERAQRQQRESQFTQRQRQAEHQQRQYSSERRTQQAEQRQAGRQTDRIDRVAQQRAENEQRIQPVRAAESELRLRRQQEALTRQTPRPQPESRTQQISRPQPEPLMQPISQHPESRTQQISRPQPEPRMQPISRQQPESRTQQISRPQPEPRTQQITRPKPEPRPQQISRPQQEQRIQRSESRPSSRVEQQQQQQQQ